MKRQKQSVAGTLRFSYRRLNTIEKLKNEIEAQISNDTETEIVSLTYEEFKRLMGEIKNKDELTQSDNQGAEGPLAEVDQFIRLKMEVAQKMKIQEKYSAKLLLRVQTVQPYSKQSNNNI